MKRRGSGWHKEGHRHRMSAYGISTNEVETKSINRYKRIKLASIDGFILEKDRYDEYYVVRPDSYVDNLFIDSWGNIFYDMPEAIPEDIMKAIAIEIKEDIKYGKYIKRGGIK